jgi:hypothetical protein
LTQIPGEFNGIPGRLEFIADRSGNLTHQRFVAGGVLLMALLTYPDFEMIPGLFAYDTMQLKWGDILWAYTNGILGWYDIVDIAKKRLKDDINLDLFILTQELADVTKSNIWQVSLTIEKLAQAEPSDECKAKKKFLYISLARLYKNWTSLADPFDAIDRVYIDFGYPKEIEPFIWYMPSTDGYKPARHTREENIDHLHTKLFNFLKDND